jgi:hypothetical protein
MTHFFNAKKVKIFNFVDHINIKYNMIIMNVIFDWCVRNLIFEFHKLSIKAKTCINSAWHCQIELNYLRFSLKHLGVCFQQIEQKEFSFMFSLVKVFFFCFSSWSMFIKFLPHDQKQDPWIRFYFFSIFFR